MSVKIDIRGWMIPVDVLADELRRHGYRLISEKRLQLLTLHGYVDRYYELTQETETYISAWERTEKEYFDTFNTKRFDTYNAFRTSTAVQKIFKRQ